MLQLEELKCRKRILRQLAFTTVADIVDMKGRKTCETSSGDELLLTELVFNDVFKVPSLALAVRGIVELLRLQSTGVLFDRYALCVQKTMLTDWLCRASK